MISIRTATNRMKIKQKIPAQEGRLLFSKFLEYVYESVLECLDSL